MNKAWGYIILFLLITLSVLVTNCGNSCGVTETCNPGQTSNDNTGSSNVGDNAGIFDGDVETVDSTGSSGDGGGETSEPTGEPMVESLQISDLLTSVCEVLAGCYVGVDAELCLSELNTDNGMLTEFGVNTAIYSSFAAVQTAIDLSSLDTSNTEWQTCISNIEAVSCQSMDAAGSFNNTSSSDYTNVYLMIPDGC